jgi:hypothetical protein
MEVGGPKLGKDVTVGLTGRLVTPRAGGKSGRAWVNRFGYEYGMHR